MEYIRKGDTQAAQKKSRKKRLRALFIVVGVCTVIGGLFALYIISQTKPITTEQSHNASSSAQAAQTQPAARYSSIEGRYLFNGTIVVARAVERDARRPDGSYDYARPFSQLSSLRPELYDAWSAVLECPITDQDVPYQQQVSRLIFNCRPEFLPELTKYVQLFNLANNHTGDINGAKGLALTREYLAKAGVQHYGNFDPSVTRDICEVISLPVRLQKNGGGEEKSQLPVAFCTWHYFNYNRGPTEAELEPLRTHAATMPVFGFVEMGAEYVARAGAQQRQIARLIIDGGAEFVFANNPHWVQDSEVYKDRLIVYSLGNFIFDQIDAETQRGVSIDTKLSVPYDENTAQWIELGKQCNAAGFQDECLAKAKEKGLSKMQLKLTYAPVASQGGAGKLTRIATPEVQKLVEERLNWPAVRQQFGL